MSVVSGNGEPVAPGEIDRPEVIRDMQEDTPPCNRAIADDDDDV